MAPTIRGSTGSPKRRIANPSRPSAKQEQVHRREVHRVRAEGGEEQDPRVEVGPRDPQKLRPCRASGRFSTRRKTLPMNRLATSTQTRPGWLVEQLRPGLDAVAHQRREDDRRGRGGRQPQRQQRHQHARRGGVVGRLGPRDTLDRAPPELARVLGELALRQVAEEGRDLGAAGGDRPEREAERGAAQPGLPGPPPVRPGHPRPPHRDDDRAVLAAAPRPTAPPPPRRDRPRPPRRRCCRPGRGCRR